MNTPDSRMIAVNKILDMKQDVAALLEAYPKLGELIDGHLADAVDALLKEIRTVTGTPWEHLPHLTVSVDKETHARLIELGEETAAKFPSRR